MLVKRLPFHHSILFSFSYMRRDCIDWNCFGALWNRRWKAKRNRRYPMWERGPWTLSAPLGLLWPTNSLCPTMAMLSASVSLSLLNYNFYMFGSETETNRSLTSFMLFVISLIFCFHYYDTLILWFSISSVDHDPNIHDIFWFFFSISYFRKTSWYMIRLLFIFYWSLLLLVW